MDNPETLPLFPLHPPHAAWVRFASLAWPLEGHGYEICCPACGVHQGLLWESFDVAFQIALLHRAGGNAAILKEDWERSALINAQTTADARNLQGMTE